MVPIGTYMYMCLHTQTQIKKKTIFFNLHFFSDYALIHGFDIGFIIIFMFIY